MMVIPAVDVLAGRCVRLQRGDYARETVYGDVGDRVRRFIDDGARRLHLVDLDAARGRPLSESRSAVEAAVATAIAAGVEIQVGGGVRGAALARGWIERGAAYIVLGSLALRDPEAALAICQTYPGRILLGLDAVGDGARAQGWTEAAGCTTDHLRAWAGWPTAGVVRTAIDRDGLMAGPDIEGLRQCVADYSGPVIASGGVSSMADLEACGAVGVAGTIVGRALYEGGIEGGVKGGVDLRTALERWS